MNYERIIDGVCPTCEKPVYADENQTVVYEIHKSIKYYHPECYKRDEE